MEPIEIMQQVEQFYSSAWDKLVITGGIIFAVFGVLTPIIFQLLQNRTLRLQAKEIKLDISSDLEELKSDLRDEIKEEYQKEIEKLSDEIERKSNGLMGMAFHLQGNSQLNQNRITAAIDDYLQAVKHYLKSKDFVNLQIVCTALKSNCLPKISLEDLEDIFHQRDTSEEEFFNLLPVEEDMAKKEIYELKYQLKKVAKKKA